MTTHEWTLPKNVDGFRLPIPKLKDNTLPILWYVRHIPRSVCKISSILAVTGACIMENTLETTGCFLIVCQASTECYQKCL